MIRQLLYRSGQLYEFTPSCMQQLLSRARVRNSEQGITGMLLHFDGLFMQLLEGPVAVVDALYARIATDPRHCEVRLLVRGEVRKPLLPQQPLAWAEGLMEGDVPMFPGVEAEQAALDVLMRAGDNRVAAAMLGFLRGEQVPGGGLGCARLMERVL